MKIMKKTIILVVISILFSCFSLLVNAENDSRDITNSDTTQTGISESTDSTEPIGQQEAANQNYELDKINTIMSNFATSHSIKDKNKIAQKLESEYKQYVKSNKNNSKITLTYTNSIIKIRKSIITQYKNEFKKTKKFSKKISVYKKFIKQKKFYKGNAVSDGLYKEYKSALSYMKKFYLKKFYKDYKKYCWSSSKIKKCKSIKKLGKQQILINDKLDTKLYKYKKQYKILLGKKKYNKFIRKIRKTNFNYLYRIVKLYLQKGSIRRYRWTYYSHDLRWNVTRDYYHYWSNRGSFTFKGAA